MTRQHDHLVRGFRASAATYPDRVATRIRRGDGWEQQTFAQLAYSVRHAAAALVEHGLQPGDRVALLAGNRPEWTAADLAALSCGVSVVPIFPSSTAEQIRHIVEDSGSRALIIDGQAEADKLKQLPAPLAGVEFVVQFVPTDLPDAIDWPSLRSDDRASLAEVDRRVEQAGADDVATLIYTSGTTGDPKGVVLTHRAFTSEFAALDAIFTLSPDDHSLCFLPLSHALERAWTFYVLSHGCMNTYVHNPKQVAPMLAEVKPTLFVCVPALYEKVYAAAREQVADAPAKAAIFRWALRVGAQAQRQYRKGKQPSWIWRWQLPLADKLVFSSVRAGIGGPKTVLAAGGAPLRAEIEEFFSACGVLVCQGYGLTEAAPLISFNSPGAFKFGTVGQVMQGGEVKLGADGEILYRGPNVMRGYWKNEAATAEAIDPDGFLHTGDVGYVDRQGFVVITDRLKDILVTSNGKNVAPQPIEGLILSDPLFEHAVVLGNNRPAITLLVKPSFPALEKLAADLQVRWENREELMSRPEIVEALRARVDELTAKLPHHEKIRDVRVMDEEPTQENGMLTPTLKLRRRQVEERFAEVIDDMYTRLAELRQRH